MGKQKQLRLKRALDIAGALCILLTASPAFALAAMLAVFAVGRPVLFVQERAGIGGRPFDLYKFRTMNNRRAACGALLPDGDRLGRVGRFLRATSLDELPQLFNVLRGDMSLVGPRPLLLHYLPRYSAAQKKRHDVKPGITGWAQVRGRNALSWEEKFAYDVWYTEHWSLRLDFFILLMTVAQVIFGVGVKHAGHATMPEFLGSDEKCI